MRAAAAAASGKLGGQLAVMGDGCIGARVQVGFDVSLLQRLEQEQQYSQLRATRLAWSGLDCGWADCTAA